MSTIQQTNNAITIKGSVKLITEYLSYGINSILFQRGIYPPETFKTEEHFGMTILVSQDEKIKEFLHNVLEQMKVYLVDKKLQQLSLILINMSTKETLERWDFKIKYEKTEDAETGDKDIKEIQTEIREVMRQICATVTFLPLLDCPCHFDVLIYTKSDTPVPENWDERGPVYIANAQNLQLKSFSTSMHRMNTFVCYKTD